jgi:hypothetical protein
MAFQPLVPAGGLAGYRFVERTLGTQLETFSARPDIARDIAYFRETAGEADTAEKLAADRRLLRVALGAFGLADQVDKRAFVRKVLEDGTIKRDALANRLSTPAWRELSATLGYGDVGGLLGVDSVREELVERYRIRQFEEAVGARNADIGAALAFKRSVGVIAESETVDRAGWFRILGRQDLRPVIETALGLPSSFGALDIDQQRQELERLARRELGGESPAVFRDPEVMDDVIRRFLALSAARAGPSPLTPGSTALTLLQSGGLGAGARTNLFASALVRA